MASSGQTSKKRLALAIIDFLNNSLTTGTVTSDDSEGIEIATKCIAEAFKVDPSDKAAVSDALGGQNLLSIYSVYKKLKGNKSARGSTADAKAASAGAAEAQGEGSEELKKRADAIKAQGNAAMQQKDYNTAIEFYTQALELQPLNPIYLSNRAAAYLGVLRHEEAKSDAEMAVAADPKFAKAWGRLGLAKFALGDAKGSMQAYKKGIEAGASGGSEAMRKGYKRAKRKFEEEGGSLEEEQEEEARGVGVGGAGGVPDLGSLPGMFGGGEDGGMPSLSEMMNNPTMRQMAQNLMGNPDMLNNLMSNPRIRQMAEQFAGQYGQTGRMEELEAATSMARLAGLVTPDSYTDQAGRINDLGIRLIYRYQRTGRMEDLEEALEKAREAVQATPRGHPDQAGRLNNLGNMLECRHKRTGRMEDLEEAIEMAGLAVQLTPGSDPNRATWLSNLGNKLSCRYERTGRMTDLEEAIEKARLAVQATSANHPSWLFCLNNLAIKLAQRYKLTGQMEDLKEAVETGKLVVQATPEHDPDRAARLHNLGNFLGDWYQRTKQMEDLEEAIKMAELAAQAIPDDHPNMEACLNGLGQLLCYRYQRVGRMEDLEDAIKKLELAVQATPDNHPGLAMGLSSLGAMLGYRYAATGQMKDLEDAIGRVELAVQATPADHPDLAVRLDSLVSMLGSLGKKLVYRYDRTGRIEDLEAAITNIELAMQATPSDHPGRAVCLNKPGNMLESRYAGTERMEDLDGAIRKLKLSVQAIPDDHPGRATYLHRLHSLGSILDRRYQRTGQMEDLEEAIKGAELAVGSTQSLPAEIYDRKLSSTRKEIRLLYVVRNCSGTNINIVCTLQTTSLAKSRRYEALSYEWGGQAQSYGDRLSIKINGRVVQLTPNLAQCLAEMPIDKAIPLWIDALCINQQDDAEKSEQVQMMKDIYEKADMVRAWLGPRTPESDLAMDILEEVQDLPMGVSQPVKTFEQWFSKHSGFLSYLWRDRRWDAFFSLCSRSYWTRMWIAQELVVSRSARVFCGTRSASLRTLLFIVQSINLKAIDSGGGTSYQEERSPSAAIGPGSIARNWFTYHLHDGDPGPSDNLLLQLQTFRMHQCSNPRDKVYSLLGISKPYANVELSVDYQASTEKVYRDTALYIIQGSSRLDILLPRGKPDAKQHLPSWVPDWRNQALVPAVISAQSSLENGFSTGGPTLSIAELLEDEQVLKVEGIILGNIQSTSPDMPSLRIRDDIPQDFRSKIFQNIHYTWDSVDELLQKVDETFQYALTGPGSSTAAGFFTAGHLSDANNLLNALYEVLFLSWYSKQTAHDTWSVAEFCKFASTFAPPENPNDTRELVFGDNTRKFGEFLISRTLFKITVPKLNETSGLRPLLGVSNNRARVGDHVAIVIGCCCPLVLRRREKESSFEIISDAYVEGVMNGEALEVLSLEYIYLR